MENLKDYRELVVFIPCETPWQWSTDVINQTAIELSKKGALVVCYLTTEVKSWKDLIKNKKSRIFFREFRENLYLFSPLYFIPFRRFKWVEDANLFLNILIVRFYLKFASFVKSKSRKIFWIFEPNMFLFRKYFKEGYQLLYDCTDFFIGSDKESAALIRKHEQDLCKAADVVTANSKVLQKHLQNYRKNVHLVPQGFRLDGFEVDKKNYINLNLKPPVIGFVGGINNRLDTAILLPLIKNNLKWNFVLWGPLQKELRTGSDRFDEINQILSLPNVKTGQSTDKAEIPGIISQFDIGMIPYDVSQDFNKYCYPMKVFEYFYLGKPVVSTEITELARFPDLVKIGKNYSEWEKIIKKLQSSRWPKKLIADEKRLAEQNSWANKVNQIVAFLQ